MKNTIKTLGLTAITALTLTACGGSDGGSDSDYTPHPYDAPPISEALKAEYLNAVNTARATGRSCGVLGFYPASAPLVWDDRLYKAAYEHSEDMAISGIYSHTGSGTASDWTAQVQELGRGSELGDRLDNNNYIDKNQNGASENVGADYKTTQEIVNAWLASDGHCRAIMSEGDRGKKGIFGMAHVGAYWTQIFSIE